MNKPIKKYKSGLFSTAVWDNHSEKDGKMFNFKTITLKRSWKDSISDEWKSETIHLRKSDLNSVISLLNKTSQEVLVVEEGTL